MTEGTGERIFRACIRCRQRKTKCDLQTIGEASKPPCLKCHLDGQHCVLAGSRRGGDYSHLRGKNRHGGASAGASAARHRDRHSSVEVRPNLRENGSATAVGIVGAGANANGQQQRDNEQQETRESSGEPAAGVQNPLEALQILVQAASSPSAATHATNTSPGTTSTVQNAHSTASRDVPQNQIGQEGSVSLGLESYAPVADGLLDPALLDHLLQHYAERYHPFMPVVPGHVLDPKNIHRTAVEEPFLLSSVLVISTKDRQDLKPSRDGLWAHICKGILDIVLGASAMANLGSVEGLLLLAEWAPHASIGIAPLKPATNGEDCAAWTLVGLAVRQAYLLHLDTYSFRADIEGEDKATTDRKRLAWTFTFLADRHISIRMGQAFWCRGIGSSARFTAEDFPALQPKHAYEDDHAAILLANLELTSLFGTVHDILYATKSRTVGLMLMGDYTRYLDESSRAMAAWKDAWTRLAIAPYLKCLLEMQYEYLALYINAFAFQAVICRTLEHSRKSAHREPKRRTFFPDGVFACPDSRYILAAVDAATNLLRIVSQSIDPTRHLRYLPVRYYLYTIHSAVFLFKAHSLGAITPTDHQRSVTLVRDLVTRLDAAAAGERHIAFRYSKLLSGLWFREPASESSQSDGSQHQEPPSASSVSHGASTPNNLSQQPSGTALAERRRASFGVYATATATAAAQPDEGPGDARGYGIDSALGTVTPSDPFSFLEPGLTFPGSYNFQSFPVADGFLNGNGTDYSLFFPPLQ